MVPKVANEFLLLVKLFVNILYTLPLPVIMFLDVPDEPDEPDDGLIDGVIPELLL